MAYFATARCGQCTQPFTFNPHLVPSLNGVPFCKTCVERANPKRIANGLKPIPISGAYDVVSEPTDTETELGPDYYERY